MRSARPSTRATAEVPMPSASTVIARQMAVGCFLRRYSAVCLRSVTDTPQAWQCQRRIQSVLPRMPSETMACTEETAQPKYAHNGFWQAMPSELWRLGAPRGLRVAFHGRTSTISNHCSGGLIGHKGQSKGVFGCHGRDRTRILLIAAASGCCRSINHSRT